MRLADFLFPTELQVQPTNYGRVLVIGSCLAETYVKHFTASRPHVAWDFILFNHFAELPDSPPQPLDSYSFQYVQIPLRTVLTDAVVRAEDLTDADWSTLLDDSLQRLELMFHLTTKYSHQSSVPTFISNFIVPQSRLSSSQDTRFTASDLSHVVQILNLRLAKLAREASGVIVVDVEGIAGSLGKRYFLDDSMVFPSHGAVFFRDWSEHERFPAWTAPEPGRIDDLPELNSLYSEKTDEFLEAVLRQLEHEYRIILGTDIVKLVIFDLDNTLWRGMIGEHYGPGQTHPYTDGWPLGVWEAIHRLRSRGILVAVCSKNSIDIIRDRWDVVVQPPFLALEDFLTIRVNWQPKSESVASIITQCALTPGSVVFVDDNPVEREAVAAALPGIRVIGSNPFETRRLLLWSAETTRPAAIKEASLREASVKGKLLREESASKLSREDFLHSLACRVDIDMILEPGHPDLPRAFELVNKTNQFNTTGRRWTPDEFDTVLRTGGAIIVCRVSDKFSNHGLVGALILHDRTIEQFVLSCRVLGLELERAILAWTVNAVRGTSSDHTVSGVLVETPLNQPCHSIYVDAGFTRTASEQVFTLEPGVPVTLPGHVRVGDSGSV